ncbi:MAG: glycosyltransferase family 4 protein, partial [Caulobacteraceae bacterium]
AFLCERMAAGFAALYRDRPGGQRYIVGNSRRTETPEVFGEARDDEAFTVGFLSNLSFEKGLERYFEVVKALSARAPGVKGLLAGPASTEAVEAYVRRELAANPNVEWLGAVYGGRKAAFFGRIDAFVFPTVYENEAQPNVLFEALAFGVPVATLRRGCIGEDLAGAGSLVADDPERFSAASVDFLAEMAGAAGRAKLQERRAQARARFDTLRGQALAEEAALFDRFRR